MCSHFGMIFPLFWIDFTYFSGVDFRMHFWICFSSLSAPKWLPKGSPSRHKIWRKIKNVLSSSIDTFQMPFWHHFGCILAAIWKVLGAFWSPFAVDVGNYGSQLGHILATIDSHVASSDPTHWISLLVIRATSGKSIDWLIDRLMMLRTMTMMTMTTMTTMTTMMMTTIFLFFFLWRRWRRW